MGLKMEHATVFVVLAVVAVAIQGTDAATYVVGDSLGWTIPSGGAATYTAWASKHTYSPGDVLVFSFPVGAHDVAEVTKAGYDSCSSNGPLSLQTLSPANVTLTKAGTHYFICTFGQHCSLGQKLAVNVASTSGTPTTTPPPTAATSPPTAAATPPPTSSATPPPASAATPPPTSAATPPPTAAATPPTAAATPPSYISSPPTAAAAAPPTFFPISPTAGAQSPTASEPSSATAPAPSPTAVTAAPASSPTAAASATPPAGSPGSTPGSADAPGSEAGSPSGDSNSPPPPGSAPRKAAATWAVGLVLIMLGVVN